MGADNDTVVGRVGARPENRANDRAIQKLPRELILRQLTLILASPAFRNCKRYSAVLKYLVDRTLEGRGGELKERNINIDVFGRPAGLRYDHGALGSQRGR